MLTFLRSVKTGRKFSRRVNPYVQDQYRKGKSALDDLIKDLSSSIIAKLNQIEEETDFELLFKSPIREVKEEAILLKQEIKNIKTLLQEL